MAARSISGALKSFFAILAVSIAATFASPAAVVISWLQDGDDVVANYAGTLGADAVTNSSAGQSYATIDSTLFVRFNVGSYSYTGGFSSSDSTLIFSEASSASGDTFGYLNDGSLVGPLGFTADTYVSGTFRFEDITLEQIGAVFTSDFVVLKTTGGSPLVTYEQNAIPEPGTGVLVGVALVGGCFLRRRRYASLR